MADDQSRGSGAGWPGGLPPSRLPRARFMELFGDLAEHTPAIAEAVHAAGLTPAEDNAAGLAAAFGRAVQAMPLAAQTAFLNAHPDLAGKLHAAKQLTADSTKEQGSAGLDALTEAERARFLELNAAYRARFGFPFIIAAKGRTRAEILEAFEHRLQRDAGTEHAEALRQIGRIMLLRLQDRLSQ